MHRAAVQIIDHVERSGPSVWYCNGCRSLDADTVFEMLPNPVTSIEELRMVLAEIGMKEDLEWSPARVTTLDEIIVVIKAADGSISVERWDVVPLAEVNW